MNRFYKIPAALALAMPLLAGYVPQAAAQARPTISQFDVDSDDRLAPGSRIDFTLEGTANGVASVRIDGIARKIPLKEVSPGDYQGTYIVKSGDVIAPTASAQATLSRRNRSVTMVAQDALGTTLANASRSTTTTASGTPEIEGFSVRPIDSWSAGNDISFVLKGTPGARASFTIAGFGAQPMREVSPGHYEGNHRIRPGQNLNTNRTVTATLVANGRTATTDLGSFLNLAGTHTERNGNATGNLQLRDLMPANGTTVSASAATQVSGSFDRPVDPNSVVLTVAGRDVTRSATITPTYFNYRADLPPGSYDATVVARDQSGNSTRQSWHFNVATQAAAFESSLPLSILSHSENALITGATEIRGRTAPYATVNVKVTGVSSVFGMLGLSSNLLDQTVNADANGNFAVAFTPRSTGGKNPRYQVSLTATKNGLSTAQTLNLVGQ